jgi:hypothetical protein
MPVPFSIDTTSFRKDTTLPLGQGYSMRPGGRPISIVIHTTNSPHRNTRFDSEAEYLRDSRTVGAHFLVGKQGQIAQLLHPDLAAWHAGASLSGFGNAHSIGIETHVSQGETWTPVQRDALTWLVRRLMVLYRIGPEMVETHRKIAQPSGRKSDPEAWPDASFYAWRAQLVAPVSPPTPPASPTKRFVVKGLPVYQAANHQGALWGHLAVGEQVAIDDFSNGHLADGRGFVDLAGLEAL